MQYIFNSRSEQGITSGSIIGNTELEPQTTITYQVAWQHQIGEDYVMDISAYYKNTYNYVSTKRIDSEEDDTFFWYQYISEDYGSARGIDFNLSKMLSNFISGSFSYSLGWAEGNNSETEVQDEATNLREFALDWDVRHNFNFNVEFRIGDDEDFWIPFTNVRFPLDDFVVNFLYNVTSGKPYTPNKRDSNDQIIEMDTNTARYTYTDNADITISKRFTYGRRNNKILRAYCQITNLFDKRNVLFVHPLTGEPFQDGEDLTETGLDFVYEEDQIVHDLALRNPSNLSGGRKIIFGISYNW